MCGIAVLISDNGGAADAARLEHMMDLLRHRGNRQPVVRQAGRAALGCARLAIVGRDHNGAQPLTDAEGQLTVVFNGEIYNYRELCAELKSEGYKFRTKCDTEVLLHGYKRWGGELPAKLKGMYAFVIWDEAQGEFFAARDPFGIKPLYYAHEQRQWAFSSQIYPLIEAGFRDVKSLAAGTYIHNGQQSAGTLLPPVTQVEMEEEWAAGELRRLIRQSVSRHMETDLPVAVFCSGGIDSSILLWEAAEVARDRRTPVVAFCVGTPDCEDLKYARIAAEVAGVELRHVPIEPERMVENILRVIATIETFEPNHVRAGTASLALARDVSQQEEDFRVALVGEGADELFGGYEEFPKAVRDGRPKEALVALFRRFIGELHKTQLKRVDRASMAYGIEARVPFLDIDLASFVMSIPIHLKLAERDGKVWSKYILRRAYRDVLPAEIVWRRKVPMGEGAGVGDNSDEKSPFSAYTRTVMTKEEFTAVQRRHPHFQLATPEEAYYFTVFVNRFGPLELARRRPMTNVEPTT